MWRSLKSLGFAVQLPLTDYMRAFRIKIKSLLILANWYP